MLKLLILDRDGVINHDSDAYIKSVEEWIPIPGSIQAIAALSRAGWTVAVATNQSGIARGYYDLATLDAMHARLRELVAEEGGEVGLIVYCPHGPDEGCDCRKPRPGMLQTIARHYATDLEGLWFVGDSKGDLQAALAVDCQPVLVKTGKGQKTLAGDVPNSTLVFDDLAAVAAELIHTSVSPNTP
ncbi:D-glycero-D-manno-heptose 1,7-bisphosphate phosphatase [Pseudomonas asturiensis]|uniref:D,D-heptose 1,7-bisphosphate phosphatase n=1 Tax=Pseudomonas asturiensis TaxID=1190415 RepID=A0A1M7QJ38_9PSED|nr:D-glycero-beta-D-manno-heptose 1,7-bisphosphate 7-phosphatase [Pseudomonas asturiensis]SHN31163.1 D-glycero-D-manno-heptose 1,7-bisphosphate phosphatase [Pseudomonas asturiensis]